MQQAQPGVGQAQVVLSHRLHRQVARLDRHALRLLQTSHAHRKVVVALVSRAEGPRQAAGVTRLPRQRHGLLGQCAVRGGVGLSQLHAGQHAQGLALVRRIAQGLEALCGIGGTSCGQRGVGAQRRRGLAQQGQRQQRRALGCGCHLGGLQGVLGRLQGLGAVLLARLHQRQVAQGVGTLGLRP